METKSLEQRLHEWQTTLSEANACCGDAERKAKLAQVALDVVPALIAEVERLRQSLLVVYQVGHNVLEGKNCDGSVPQPLPPHP